MTVLKTTEQLKKLKERIEGSIERSGYIQDHIKNLSINGQIEKLGEDAVRKLMFQDRVLVRRYSLEAAAEMVGVTRHIISTAEANGELPEPDFRVDTARKIRAGYTINQINDMRAHFNTLPEVEESIKSSVIAFLNLKGGAQKTTMTVFFAHWLATKGYKILLVDTDPQASLTEAFGLSPDTVISYSHTMAPFILEDDDALVDAGHPPGSFETLHYAVHPTYWNHIDIIPGCLDLLNIDLMANRESLDRQVSLDKLRKGLKEVGEGYDFILIDGTPSLNVSTLNVITATDQVFVPAPAEMSDYRSTVKFLGMLQEVIDNRIRAEAPVPFPDINFLINKKVKTNYSDLMTEIIENTFNEPDGSDDIVLKNHVHSSIEVGKAASDMVYLFEANKGDSSNREGFKKAEDNYTAVFEEALEVLRRNLDPNRVSITKKDIMVAKAKFNVLPKGEI
tara:strand:+ start:24276 stop:25625 length:1350 start_codon:yes stop_codon:yes gene_type:complete